MNSFAEKYHVFAYSRRSHFPNPYVPYPEDYSIKVEAQDLVSLIYSLAVKPVHLVGWSYGAFIAAVAAKDDAHLVRSLVLAEPPIMSFLKANPATEPLYLDYLATAQAVKGALASGNDVRAVQIFIDGVSGKGVFDHTPPGQQKRMLQNARTLYELTSAERDPFSRDDAEAVDTPTLLLNGERSAVFLQKIVQELAGCLPQNEHVTIATAGHPMHSQNPLAYNKAVLGFFDAH